MLRLDSMASASGSGPNPTAPTALSDEQAEQFAASFTPSWDADDGLDDATNGNANATLVDAPAVGSAQAAALVAPQPAAPAPAPAPAPAFNAKQTLIGTAPQANAPSGTNGGTNGGHDMRAAASSAEAIDPDNILDSRTAPQPPVRAAAAPAAAPAPASASPSPASPSPHPSLKGTQIMHSAPAQVEARKAQSRPPPAAVPPNNAPKNARVAVSADPFAAPARSAAKRPHSEDLDDFVPKKSSKTVYFVVAGLAVAAGLGLFLKFALGDDGTKPAPVEQHATGPAVTTAEIPPPPPKVDTPPPATATATTAAAKVDSQPPATLPAPQAARQPDPPAAPAHVAAAAAPQPRPRQPPPPPPQAEAKPPPPVTPKTAPKPPNGSIVRDNPF